MKKHIVTILSVILIAFGLILAFSFRNNQNSNSINPTPSPDLENEWYKEQMDKKDLIKIELPRIFEEVSSPLHVKGEARGNWYFEASFPVHVIDANGEELAAVPVMTTADWMTTNFVPFDTTIVFKEPKTKTGFVVFKKDNPSGLPENEKELKVPVKFK